jgi:hypothetical protein
MATRTNVVLTFDSSLGEIVRLSIPRADTTLTTARAQAGMEVIIANGAVRTVNGAPIAARTAELVTTSRTALVTP